MPTIKRRTALLASQVIENIIAGSPYEFVGVPSKITVAAVKAAAGVVELSVQVGPELLLDRAPLNAEPTVNAGAMLPDNLLLEEFAAPGDRITISVRETSGAASFADVFLRIEPV